MNNNNVNNNQGNQEQGMTNSNPYNNNNIQYNNQDQGYRDVNNQGNTNNNNNFNNNQPHVSNRDEDRQLKPEIININSNNPNGDMSAKYIHSEYHKILNSAQRLFIKQSLEWNDVMTYYTVPYKYLVYMKDNSQLINLFWAEEGSSCCERNCYNTGSRPFLMELYHMSGTMQGNTPSSKGPLATVFEKRFTYNCCCIDIPKMYSKYLNRDGPNFGKLERPFNCTGILFHIYDSSKEVKYSISGDYCQCGIVYSGSCCFEPVKFYIYEGSEPKSDVEAVGMVIKQAMGYHTLVTGEDNFEINFPQSANVEDKLNIIGVCFFIDYNIFGGANHDRKKKRDY
mmetsp:Transcript_25589/g.26681  ORF Transcript_25589/g.26681 Transcript_25589/m.26681 type:complete len:339 (-) Transcript_25589:65-1081(-)